MFFIHEVAVTWTERQSQPKPIKRITTESKLSLMHNTYIVVHCKTKHRFVFALI